MNFFFVTVTSWAKKKQQTRNKWNFFYVNKSSSASGVISVTPSGSCSGFVF
jgi:hypothetical protein